MKKFILLVLGISLFSIIFYFSQDRMALEVLQKENLRQNVQYLYNKDNHLQHIALKGIKITFLFDQSNRRVSKLIDQKVVEKYLWQGDGKLYIVNDSNDTVLREYLYKTKYDTLPFGMKSRNQTYYFIYNKMQTLRAVLNQQKQVVKVLDYDQNGKLIKDTNPNLKVDFAYASGLLESKSGLLFFPEGVYDPKSAQWISKIKKDDIIQNLKHLSSLPQDDVYLCSDTLDTYYHSYLCTNGKCGGFYAIDYMNYFDGRGTMSDNSKYFHPDRCNKIDIKKELYDVKMFRLCIEKHIESKEIKIFNAFANNCHDEVDAIIKKCKSRSLKENI
ncbi:MAG: hypothetical protein WCY75_10470 [Sulfurimonadaceae bacterium]|jgi:hypothetical protein|nr:hypothetical protein [Arcobacteraceae bacterium]